MSQRALEILCDRVDFIGNLQNDFEPAYSFVGRTAVAECVIDDAKVVPLIQVMARMGIPFEGWFGVIGEEIGNLFACHFGRVVFGPAYDGFPLCAISPHDAQPFTRDHKDCVALIQVRMCSWLQMGMYDSPAGLGKQYIALRNHKGCEVLEAARQVLGDGLKELDVSKGSGVEPEPLSD